MMSQPYITKNMRLEVDGHVLDMIELVNLEVIHDGGIESEYGQDVDTTDHNILKPRNRHKVGIKRCKFTIRRWFKAGVESDLLYDLHNQDTVFTLKEYLNNVIGASAGLEIDNCEIYHYISETGTANDIIIEEAQGEGLTYEEYTPDPCDAFTGEQVVNGTFVSDLSGWTVTNCVWDAFNGCKWSPAFASIEQTFATPIPVSCIDTFSARFIGDPCGGSSTITIIYVDTTTTTISNIHTGTIDILPFLTAGQTVKSILIACVHYSGLSFVDNITLVC